MVEGKGVVITGASRGLGLGMAQWFQERGARLGLCARGRVPMDGGFQEAVDVTDVAAVHRFASNVAEALGPIDLWINNAGVLGPVAPF